MLKFLLKFVFTLIVVFVALVFFAGGGLVKYLINHHSERLTGLEMNVAGADLSILTGQLALRNLAIRNPEGYDTPHVATISNLQVTLEPKSFLSDTIQIDQVLVSGTRVFFEGNLNGNNVQDLQKILTERIPAEAHDHDGEAKVEMSEVGEGKKMLIKDLSVLDNEVVFALKGVPMDAARQKLKDIKLVNVGENNGATVAQVLDQILMPLFEQVDDAALSAFKDPNGLIERFKSNTGEFIDGIGKSIRGFFEDKPEGVEGTSPAE